MAFVNGKTNPKDAIPTAPAPCSQGFDDGEGGAIYMRDGNLIVVDCVFTNDHAAPLGPDTGGGAIYVNGSKNGVHRGVGTFTNDQGEQRGRRRRANAPIQNLQLARHEQHRDRRTTRTTTTRSSAPS